MRVFITGASGYAGYYAALRLASAGHSVVGLVRNPNQPRLQALRTHEIRLAVGDVGEPATYREELERSDIVIHTLLDKRRPFETDRALFAALRSAPRRKGATAAPHLYDRLLYFRKGLGPGHGREHGAESRSPLGVPSRSRA